MSPSAIQCQTYRIKTAAAVVVVLVVLASWAELYIVSYRQVTDSLY